MNFITHIAIMICIYAILAVGLNVAVGYTGLLNFGYVAFFGMGAYISALLTLNGVPYLAAFPLAGVGAGIFGYLITLITKKLSGDYLALATLAFAYLFASVAQNWQSLTRGPLGLPGIPKPHMLGIRLNLPWEYLIWALLILSIVVYVVYRVTRSRYGRLLEAVRDEPIGLASLGKNVFRLKWQSMVISCLCAGLAGSLYAHYIGYIDPTTFYLTEIIVVYTIVLVGGLASLRGSVLAAIIIVALPEMIRLINLPSTVVGPLRQIFYALILLVILLIRPKGLWGKVELE
jgi:branched-chain amino acid transport system permease protein